MALTSGDPAEETEYQEQQRPGWKATYGSTLLTADYSLSNVPSASWESSPSPGPLLATVKDRASLLRNAFTTRSSWKPQISWPDTSVFTLPYLSDPRVSRGMPGTGARNISFHSVSYQEIVRCQEGVDSIVETHKSGCDRAVTSVQLLKHRHPPKSARPEPHKSTVLPSPNPTDDVQYLRWLSSVMRRVLPG